MDLKRIKNIQIITTKDNCIIYYIDGICENISEDEKERLKDIFIKSSLYEMEFWNMANK